MPTEAILPLAIIKLGRGARRVAIEINAGDSRPPPHSRLAIVFVQNVRVVVVSLH
jgi:hypothetical protein